MSPFVMIEAALDQALLFLPLALGLLITFVVMRITDLTVDGSFVLGAAVFAKSATTGLPSLSLPLAILAGMIAGLFSALVAHRIAPLLASILVLFMLQSLNLILMGRPNISLLEVDLMPVDSFSLLFYNLLLLPLLALFLHSLPGILLRAYGDHPLLLERQGFSSLWIRAMGLALSNGLVAFSGALSAQKGGYADTQMGLGIVLIGIGTLASGKQLTNRLFTNKAFHAGYELLSCGLGVFVYFLTLHSLLHYGVPFLYLKLMMGAFLIAVMMRQGGEDGAR